MIRSIALSTALALTATLLFFSSDRTAAAQQSENAPAPESAPTIAPQGDMTLDRLGELILRIDEEAQNAGPAWQFTVEDVTLVMMTDANNNRMRLMTPIKPSEDLTEEELVRMSQANFDTALDTRYAIARGTLWATYIHPLSELYDQQFLTAVGQTVNAAKSYGTTYSSGLLSFGGGDSRALIQRELIEELIKQGEEI